MSKKINQDLFVQVDKIIAEKIRPNIQFDGGDISLVDVNEQAGIVTVKLSGACLGCPLAPLTLRLGVERELKQALPEVKQLNVVE